MFKTRKVLFVSLIVCVLLVVTAIAQDAPESGRGRAGTGRGAAGRGRSGMRQSDSRVQNRTYIFTDTNEPLPYAVFVSSKVTKEKKAPLIIALRGADGNPTVFLRGAALDLAEKGGYILVGVMGYNSTGSYGMPVSGFGGGRGGRGGSPAMPNQPRRGAETTRGAQQARRGMGMRGAGGTAETDPAKISEYSEKDVMNVLAMVRKEFNIDDKRIYLVGHYQGGGGDLHIADKYSSIWAAAALLSPGAPNYQLDPNFKFKDVPLLIMVGENDTMIATPRYKRTTYINEHRTRI